MTFPVLVEPCDGQFAASLVGAPTTRAVGPTRAEALAALQADLAQCLARGELVSLELAPTGGVWAGRVIPHGSHPTRNLYRSLPHAGCRATGMIAFDTDVLTEILLADAALFPRREPPPAGAGTAIPPGPLAPGLALPVPVAIHRVRIPQPAGFEMSCTAAITRYRSVWILRSSGP